MSSYKAFNHEANKIRANGWILVQGVVNALLFNLQERPRGEAGGAGSIVEAGASGCDEIRAQALQVLTY